MIVFRSWIDKYFFTEEELLLVVILMSTLWSIDVLFNTFKIAVAQ